MGNPKPTLVQCLVLHGITDDDVWFDHGSGRWHSMYVRNDVTVQVEILHRDGYVNISDYEISLTSKGREAMNRRTVFEILEKLNA